MGIWYPIGLDPKTNTLLVTSPRTRRVLRVPFKVYYGAPTGTTHGESDEVNSVNNLISRMVSAIWDGSTEFVLDSYEARSLMIVAE